MTASSPIVGRVVGLEVRDDEQWPGPMARGSLRALATASRRHSVGVAQVAPSEAVEGVTCLDDVGAEPCACAVADPGRLAVDEREPVEEQLRRLSMGALNGCRG